MIKETHNTILAMAESAALSAELLKNAVCNACDGCIGEISDLNRQSVFELSELERRYWRGQEDTPLPLRAAYAIEACVAHAFSASMLLSLAQGAPPLQPLYEIARGNAQLAAGLKDLLTVDLPEEQASAVHLSNALHQCANKSRGAHALLLTNYCAFNGGKRLLPLILALEDHRQSLEYACAVLTEYRILC